MPSVHSTTRFLFALLPAVLAQGSQSASAAPSSGTPSSCSDPQLSCSGATVSNSCCLQAPGGSLLQVQLWDTDPATGPDDSWTIHGLWPDDCNGSYQESCSSSRAYTNITAILDQFGDSSLVSYMNTYWISDDESNQDFWAHEWDVHGTCINTLDPDCFSDYKATEEVPPFFQTVVNLFKTLPTYTWLSDAGITPSNSATYTSAEIQKALSAKHGNDVYLGCDDDSLYTIYYYFNARGPVQNGDFVTAAPSGESGNCPSTGIKYTPK